MLSTSALHVWSPGPRIVPTLAEVHIWTVRHGRISSRDDARRASVLSEAEVARFSRSRSASHRACRTRARGALRHILASYLATKPERIEIGANRYGKPCVTGIDFNCSHSALLTLVAVAAHAVGVDVEPLDACAGIDTFQHRFVGESDDAGVVSTPQRNASIELLRLWVIKEACLKAVGTGLVVDPRELRVVPESAAVFRVTYGAIVLYARLLDVPGHIAAVAARTLLDVVMPDSEPVRGQDGR